MTPSLHAFPVGLAVIVATAFLLVALLSRLPVIGTVLRLAFSLGLVAILALVLSERASLDPFLGGIADRLRPDEQQVAGKEVHIRMAPNGHFYANVAVNGVRRRMLIDSGATLTALSNRTASSAGLRPEGGLVPVLLQTANGTVQAQTAKVEEIRLGDITARDLRVVVSPAFGDLDVIGMNFLSRLKSWRVEDNILILVPHHPQPVKAG